MKNILIAIVLLLPVFGAQAQTVTETKTSELVNTPATPEIVYPADVPEDIENSTVVFIRMEKIPVPYPDPKGLNEKMFNKAGEKHNRQVDYNNKKYEKIVAEYPYSCKLVSRREFEEMRSAGSFRYAITATLEKSTTTRLGGGQSSGTEIDYNYMGVIYDVINNKYIIPSDRTANYEAGAAEIAVNAIKKKFGSK